MSVEDLFYDVDEFCRLFLPVWHRQLLTGGARKRRRASRLTLGEIMTVLIDFHPSPSRPFKAFYLPHRCRHGRGEFPHWLSDARRYEETWLGYRKASEAMKREYRLYINNAGNYAGAAG